MTSSAPSEAPLLAVRGAGVVFASRSGAPQTAVREVSFTLERGGALGIVGESGSGKSTLARALVGLQRLSAGEVVWGGAARLSADAPPQPAAVAPYAQLVFQDPASSLNPSWPAWWIATEPAALTAPSKLSAAERRERAAALLDRAGLPTALLDRFPHQMSGGQRQRLALARALSVSPQALVLDEPTSALDMSVQAQVLNELLRLNAEGLALALISHDLHVIRHLCETVCVMQQGALVEHGPIAQVLSTPRHPYTQQLINAARL